MLVLYENMVENTIAFIDGKESITVRPNDCKAVKLLPVGKTNGRVNYFYRDIHCQTQKILGLLQKTVSIFNVV